MLAKVDTVMIGRPHIGTNYNIDISISLVVVFFEEREMGTAEGKCFCAINMITDRLPARSNYDTYQKEDTY